MDLLAFGYALEMRSSILAKSRFARRRVANVRELEGNAGPSEDVTDQPAYQQRLAEGIVDRRGMTMLAGKTLGAPFVGSVAATLVISQLRRLLHGGTIDALVDLDLRSVEHRHVVPRRHDFGAFNPGHVSAVGT